MTATKNLIKVAKSADTLIENQDQIAIDNSNSKLHKEIAMSYNEITNQLEQEFYDKANGCSVKAQKDNLFDYKSWQ